MVSLDGVALVTGAASGIGRELARAYARAGVSAITLVDLNMDGLRTTIKLIQEEVPEVKTLVVEADTTKEDAVANMVAVTVESFGQLDYAANVAGVNVQHRLPTSEYPHSDYDRVLNINTRAVLLCMQEEIKAMGRQEPKTTPGVQNQSRAQRGSIINISSTTGLAPVQNIMPYNVSKHAVIGMTKSAAIDHGWQQIRINAVCPGMADTPLVKSRKELESSNKAGSWSTDGNVFRRLAFPEEIADVCVFLSTCRASYMTGASVLVDGGHFAALRYEPKIADALQAAHNQQ
ncbi:hypothetical protein F5884DRAFT_743680 [Xylogone sp. PMI_703]|nr:hypothetical protein F5884DRAFT_743680 [Xylogone sp. PMI_703]